MRSGSKNWVTGIGVGDVLGVGRVINVNSFEDFPKIKGGEIVIAKNATPDYILILKKIKCLITDEGGITCHIAIICRELDVAAIVATKNVTTTFKEGDTISFDTTKGVARISKQ